MTAPTTAPTSTVLDPGNGMTSQEAAHAVQRWLCWHATEQGVTVTAAWLAAEDRMNVNVTWLDAEFERLATRPGRYDEYVVAGLPGAGADWRIVRRQRRPATGTKGPGR